MNDITLDETTPGLGDARYSCTFSKHGVCVVWPARRADGDRIPVHELSDASEAAGVSNRGPSVGEDGR
jgi:hypothetical protein